MAFPEVPTSLAVPFLQPKASVGPQPLRGPGPTRKGGHEGEMGLGRLRSAGLCGALLSPSLAGVGRTKSGCEALSSGACRPVSEPGGTGTGLGGVSSRKADGRGL